MPGVFQNIDAPTRSPPGECVPPAFLVRGEDTLAGWREGGGVNILEDARHCSVLYFVANSKEFQYMNVLFSPLKVEYEWKVWWEESPGWNCLGEKLRDGSSVHMQLSSTRFLQKLKLLYVQKSSSTAKNKKKPATNRGGNLKVVKESLLCIIALPLYIVPICELKINFVDLFISYNMIIFQFCTRSSKKSEKS